MALVSPTIEQRDVAVVAEISGIPIAFEVRRIVNVERRCNGELVLVEAPAPWPFVKDHDRIEGNAPAEWSEHFDLSNWGLLTASLTGELIGSVLVAADTPDLDLLEGRGDLAAIWDIRVRPGARGRGLGDALIRAAGNWAWTRGCSELKVETQNINVGACRLYAKSGFRLREADDAAYPDFPDETQLIWTKSLYQAAR